AETEADQRAVLRARTRALVELGRVDDAFELSLQLFESSPADAEAMQQAEHLAHAAHQAERFAETCLTLADRLEQDGELRGACRLWLRLGQDAEERGDLAKAAIYYERAQLTGHEPQVTFTALRNVLETSGDMHALTLALDRYVSADPAELDADDLNEALYRIAEHNLCSGKDPERGVNQLRQALDRQTDYRRVASILETSSELQAPTPGSVQLLEEAARQLGDQALLLTAMFLSIERASIEQLREAVALAEELADRPKRELLLQTIVERSESEDDEQT